MTPASHRPWPLPAGRPRMEMSWHDLLFIHYPVPLDQLRPLIPGSLEIDTFDGQAWLGIVPFRMCRVKPYGFPPLPWLSAFAELNVRTYVTAGGKPGVWFFSLDAANPVAVAVARRFFHLPYFNAQMSLRIEGQSVQYQSSRKHSGTPPAEFRGRYSPTGEIFTSSAGSLEHWLTERYCLYAANPRGNVSRVDIHHARWPLQPAELDVEKNTMADWLGIAPCPSSPLLHFARSLDVVAWLPEWLPDAGG